MVQSVGALDSDDNEDDNDSDSVLAGLSKEIEDLIKHLMENVLQEVLHQLKGAGVVTGTSSNDVYVVDNLDALITESMNAGIDTVLSSVNWTLGKNLENLTLSGTGDISALGNALANILNGNLGNNVLNGAAGADTMTGGAGNDTYVVDSSSDTVTENDNEGVDTVDSSVSLALASFVENLVLTGLKSLNATGNDLNNVLTGNGGNNVLDGGAGADTLQGGNGNDTYVVDNLGDVILELVNAGLDAVRASVSYALTNALENLTLTGTDNLDGTGNDQNNVLKGNAGDNVLDGCAGKDDMQGGNGSDTYVVDNLGDKLTEKVNEGLDTVLSSVNWALGVNLENLTLQGLADLKALGNNLANILTGNDGNNVLNGAAGADTLSGGAGNDTYVVDNAGDTVDENADGGVDTVQSSVSYTLSSFVENLVLTGFNKALDAVGNELDNVLTGNAGNNTLDGGAGADTLQGGNGNDTYVVDNLGDVINELVSAGKDTVQSSVSFTLTANVENLKLLGTDVLNGVGNALANALTGNDGNNVLQGLAGADVLNGGEGDDVLNGGACVDKLTGGTGADTFVVDLSALGSADLVTDFSLSQGDELDISNVLVGFDPLASNISDFLQITDSGANSVVKVDRDGAGTAYGWTQVATLNGVTGLTDESALLATSHVVA